MSKNSVARKQPASNEPKRGRRRFVSSGESQKAKVSIAVEPTDLAWVESEAKARQTSISAVFGDAVARERRSKAMRELLDEIGGTDDITDKEMLDMYREWREAGLKV